MLWKRSLKQLTDIGNIFLCCDLKGRGTWLVGGFIRNEDFFALNSPTVTTHCSTLSNDAMAGNEITDVVFPNGTRNGAHGIGLFDEIGNVLIGRNGSIRKVQKRFPDIDLKVRSFDQKVVFLIVDENIFKIRLRFEIIM